MLFNLPNGIEYNEDLLEFFSFRDTCKDDPSKSYGYDKSIVYYDFLEKRVALDDPRCEKESLFGSEGFRGLVKVRFKEYDYVLKRLTDTARSLYRLSHESDINVDYVEQHIACSTMPFKVSVTIDKKDFRQFYVKKPSLERSIGKAFYNLLVDNRFISYQFNEGAIAVDSVPGKEIEDDDRPKLERSKHFAEELVRLNVFTNLVMLDDILKQTNANCSYCPEKGIYLFDFDQCFVDGDYYVLHSFKEIREHVHMQSLEKSERYKIFKSLRSNKERVHDLLKVVTENLPKPKLAWKKKEDDLGSALRKEFNKLGKWE